MSKSRPASRPRPSTPARSPIRSRARSYADQLGHHVRAGRRWGSTPASSTAVPAIPRGRRSRQCLAALEGAHARLRVREWHGCRGRGAASPRPRRSRDHPQRRVRRHLPALGEGVRAGRHRRGARSTSPTPTRSRRPCATTTRVVWVETPTNPMLTVIDIAAVATVVHAHGARVVVDNTFATPYLQQPLALGADVVVHSSTKYLGGHSDVVGGFVATNDAEIAAADRLRAERGRRGAVTVRLLPRAARRQDARGPHGPPLRERAWRSWRCWPSIRPVERVLYPGLADAPGLRVARRQMRDFGGMVSFVAAGGEAAALAVGERDAAGSRWRSRSARWSR